MYRQLSTIEERERERERKKRKASRVIVRGERMKFTELHIVVVTFHPLKFIFPFLVLSYAFFVGYMKRQRKREGGGKEREREREREREKCKRT